MALQITITDPVTGAPAHYWRLVKIEIDIDNATGLLIIGGYTSQEWRDAGGPGRFLASRRIPVDSAGYASLFAAAASVTLGVTVASAAYSLIKSQRRKIPGATLNQDGSLDYLGIVYQPSDIQVVGGVVTIPSEFADAADV